MNWQAFIAGLFSGRAARSGRRGQDEPVDLVTFLSGWAGTLAWLELPPETLREVARSRSLDPFFHYRHFRRPKKDGGWREITEPDAKLKAIQRQIVSRYFRTEQAHPSAMAFTPGQSTADHAWVHAGAEFLATADVQGFFPSTSAARVEDWWRRRLDGDVASLLTTLTTYRDCLPQGAPTSPGLSNFVNYDLDMDLARQASVAAARYSRYCDDLAFSWRGGVLPPSDFEGRVRATLHGFGYNMHPSKGWHLLPLRDEPQLVGLILTRRGRVRLPDELRQRMRQLSRSSNPGDAARLAGYQGYEKMIRKRPRKS